MNTYDLFGNEIMNTYDLFDSGDLAQGFSNENMPLNHIGTLWIDIRVKKA